MALPGVGDGPPHGPGTRGYTHNTSRGGPQARRPVDADADEAAYGSADLPGLAEAMAADGGTGRGRAGRLARYEPSRASASETVGDLADLQGFDGLDEDYVPSPSAAQVFSVVHAPGGRGMYKATNPLPHSGVPPSRLPGGVDEPPAASHQYGGQSSAFTSPAWSLSSMHLRHVMQTSGKAAEDLMRELIEEAQTRLAEIEQDRMSDAEAGSSVSARPSSAAASARPSFSAAAMLPPPPLPQAPPPPRDHLRDGTTLRTAAASATQQPAPPNAGERPQWSLMAMAQRHHQRKEEAAKAHSEMATAPPSGQAARPRASSARLPRTGEAPANSSKTGMFTALRRSITGAPSPAATTANARGDQLGPLERALELCDAQTREINKLASERASQAALLAVNNNAMRALIAEAIANEQHARSVGALM